MAEEKITNKKGTKVYVSAVGRRREAVARVRLYAKLPDNLKFGEVTLKKGDLVVNGRAIKEYFGGEVARARYELPFKITDSLNKFSATIRVHGGGTSSQLDAAVMGIARAFSELDASLRPLLKKQGLLTRDQRARERRKVGMGGKSRRKKQSPKR
ncbi:MAG: 30S ribosomal protein S9 [Candidatus Levybacteria bacterium RIFOXYA1_FULL_41_10]|nr:MAG: 30S ribosomal protein S9 [Candidatus Levybacteria bacterium GW2011_GWA1_39_34]KKR50723.1 MAG: 30S ribosomal protein S9 [Candidatus Levybacteria bacterium GW2011_GWC1_40_19]KKR72622.1 MAG: 30S ribosomal protein S9 [Candidatus Levybacteria bacterium GW2011_GWC2_40_7]KKR95323.1 MAG: 30S ribosomal protein S9 [Candidatus Levybacteria bacterium GW2011_GWA2_41_15]OGH20245.1 MAG: 30S ribosomal protein S9 [Candidatus Levybacteria bacterium RIFCSPHIGHO2_01_FULL_40_83]OGH25240.1 MAG: 30S ribosoma